MSTSYPTSKQDLTNPNATDSMQVVSHSTNHKTVNDTVENLQDKVGINGDPAQTSHDYKLSDITGSDKAASKATQVSDQAAIALNTTHRGSDGKDHSDVVINTGDIATNVTAIGLNTTHRGSDGKDHSDVVDNTTNIGTNTTAIGLNTTHRGSDGSDHSKVTANETAIGFNTTHRGSDGKDHSDVVTNTGDIATHTGAANPHSGSASSTDLTTHAALTTGTHGVSGTVVGTSDVQTFTNKTFDDPITGKQVATPANPSASYNKLYFKSDDKLYKLTSAGVETEVGTGGGGTALTTKGDLHGFDTGDARIPIGTNDQVLTADSTQALGLKWADPTGGAGAANIRNEALTGVGANKSLNVERNNVEYGWLDDKDTTGLNIAGNMTVMFWYKAESIPIINQNRTVIGKFGGVGNRGWKFNFHNNGGATEFHQFQYSTDGTDFHSAQPTRDMTQDEWHHIAVVCDIAASSFDYYLDGSFWINTSAPTGTSINQSTAPLAIGAAVTEEAVVDTSPFDGLLDEVKVYDDKRTAGEIAAEYNTQISGATAGLQGYWRMNDSLVDQTANNNDLKGHMTEKSLNVEFSSNQNAQIADASQTGLDFSGDFSLMGWFRLEAQPSADARALIGKNDFGTSNRSYLLTYSDIAAVKSFNLSNSQDGLTVNRDRMQWIYTLPLGGWHHVHVTCDISAPIATRYELFIDGASQGNGTILQDGSITGTFNGNAPFAIGSGYSSGSVDNSWDGMISDVGVFDAVVAPILTRLTGSESNVQGAWSLNNTYADLSPNGNTLSGTAAPVFEDISPFSETMNYSTDVPFAVGVDTFVLANTPTTGSPRIYVNGVRQDEGASDDYQISGDTITFNSDIPTTDKVLADYEVNSGTLGTGTTSFIYGEQVNEAPTGSLAVFTVDNAYVASSTQVYVDGQLQHRGGSNDYTESTPASGEITFTYNPSSGSIILITYQQSVSVAGNADTLDGLHASSFVQVGNSETVLSGSFVLASANGVWDDTGVSVALPAAGTYLLAFQVRGQVTFSVGAYGLVSARLYNVTDAAIVASSQIMVSLSNELNIQTDATATGIAIVTVAAAKTVRLEAKRDGATTYTLSQIADSGDGRTKLSYARLS